MNLTTASTITTTTATTPWQSLLNTTNQLFSNQMPPCAISTSSYPVTIGDYPINQVCTKSITLKLNQALNNRTVIIHFSDNVCITVPILTKVEVLKPNQVIRFTFSDKTEIKTICKENDTFDFEFAFYLAYAKYLWKKSLTSAGIEKKAKEIMDIIDFNKLVKKSIKNYFKEQKKKEDEEKKKVEEKEKKQKQAKKKTLKKSKRKQERIDEIAAAIKKANNPFNDFSK